MNKKLKILIAPNSMKGSLNAFDFSDAIEKAFQTCSDNFEIRKIPVADGGDFTGQILKNKLNAQIVKQEVIGPVGKKIKSQYAISGNIAIIEMADASGMKQCNTSDLNPLHATSYGTGQLLKDALQKGCTQIFMAIGGSATVDGGLGMMEALGFRFFNKNNETIKGNGASLTNLYRIEPAAIPQNLSIKIISDVDNPLLGKDGAASVFGPQKGATSEMVKILENGLENWAKLLQQETGKDFRNIKGAGAAGGMALPLMAFANAEIVPGADFVLQQLNFDTHIKWADIVLTGEGKIDSQTLNNKAPFAVAKAAKANNKPIFAIGGKTEIKASRVFDGIFSLTNGPVSLEEAMSNSAELVYSTAFELAKTIEKLTNIQTPQQCKNKKN